MSDLKQRIFDIIGKPHLAILATVTEDGKPWARYLMPYADNDLTLRFSTFINSRKVAQMRNNPEVHLTCGVASFETAQRYVQIQGRAVVTQDDAERKAYWRDEMKRYFTGPDDPNFAVVVVKPYRIELVSMVSMQPEVWVA